jgi:hypothetical protein
MPTPAAWEHQSATWTTVDIGCEVEVSLGPVVDVSRSSQKGGGTDVIRISLTNEQRNLEPIGSAFCQHYQTEARFFIERSISLGQRLGTGARHLVVQYGESYTGRDDLAVTATGQREFAIIIPHDWSNEKLLKFLQAPTKNPNVPYPTWEVPARLHGRPVLFELEDTSGESVARAGRSPAL